MNLSYPRLSRSLVLVGLAFLVACQAPLASAFGQGPQVGDTVRLKAFSNLGVPLHPESGNHGVSTRLPDQSLAVVHALDSANDWIEIESGGVNGWIIEKYVDAVVDTSSTTVPTGLAYTVGTWNIEYLKDGKVRGFPEYATSGGPTYPARTQEDYEAIASIIEQLDVKILLLQEIYAKAEDVDGEPVYRSAELEKIISILGTANYDYVVGSTGNTQHLAILWDKRAARLNADVEFAIPDMKVNSSSLFARQPLAGHFTLLYNGQPMNDLVVVSLHMASGQDKRANHDAAMRLTVQELAKARTEEWCWPSEEADYLLAGDFNASRFDSAVEAFWDELEADGWDVLADDAATYSPTRLAGEPLILTSTIDYIIVSDGAGGLKGEEVNSTTGTIHSGLVTDAYEFRQQASDHVPVTVEVAVVTDSD